MAIWLRPRKAAPEGYDPKMQDSAVDPARQAILSDLRRAALATYGEERVAEEAVEVALGVAATAVWRVTREVLEPMGPEPLPTHD